MHNDQVEMENEYLKAQIRQLEILENLKRTRDRACEMLRTLDEKITKEE